MRCTGQILHVKSGPGKIFAAVLAIFLAACVDASSAVAAPNQPEEASIQRPNVIIILADDLGLGDVSAYNSNSKISTPNIDALAKRGILFTDGHSGSTVCTPSRYALLTGEYAWRGPLRDGVLMPWDPPIISPKQDTLAELFVRAGYETAHIGKWHLGFLWPWRGEQPDRNDILEGGWISTATSDLFDWSRPLLGGPVDHGFDSYFGDDVPNFPPYAWIEDDHIQHADILTDVPRSLLITTGYSGGIHGSGPGEPGWRLDAVTPALQQRAVDFIRDRDSADRPWFLNLWLTSPHTPIVPLPEFDGTSSAGTYGDYVVQTDAAVGAVVDALEATGQLDNTLIWLTSDNGPETFSYRLYRRFQHDGVAGLRGVKGDAWEGGHRVPFIASWPAGGLAKGQVEAALVSQIDIYATMAELLGLVVPEGAARDSVSLAGLLRGNGDTGRDALIYHAANGNLGLRAGNWVYLPDGGFGRGSGAMWEEPQWIRDLRGVVPHNGTEALYDLSDDPTELSNVIDEFPVVAARLREQLDSLTSADERMLSGE